jgi:hypothetical protein
MINRGSGRARLLLVQSSGSPANFETPAGGSNAGKQRQRIHEGLTPPHFRRPVLRVRVALSCRYIHHGLAYRPLLFLSGQCVLGGWQYANIVLQLLTWVKRRVSERALLRRIRVPSILSCTAKLLVKAEHCYARPAGEGQAEAGLLWPPTKKSS